MWLKPSIELYTSTNNTTYVTTAIKTNIKDAATDGYSVWMADNDGNLTFSPPPGTGSMVSLGGKTRVISIDVSISGNLGIITSDGSAYYALGSEGSISASNTAKWNTINLANLNNRSTSSTSRLVVSELAPIPKETSLSFGSNNGNLSSVISIDNTLYTNTTAYSPWSSLWTPGIGNNWLQYIFDSSDERYSLQVYKNGSMTAYDNTKKAYPVYLPKTSSGAISATISTEYIYIVGRDYNLYYSTLSIFKKTLTDSSWITVTFPYNNNVRKICKARAGSKNLYFITKDNQLIYGKDMWLKSSIELYSSTNTTKYVTTAIATNVKDAATDGYSVWIVYNDGKLSYSPAPVINTASIVSLGKSNVISIDVSNTGNVGIITSDGNAYFALASEKPVINSSVNWYTMNLNNLNTPSSNPYTRTLGPTLGPPGYTNLYYGNSTPVFGSPRVITLKGQIPLLNWRDGTEYHFNGCGYSSGCPPYGTSSTVGSGLSMEADPKKIIQWVGYTYDSWCEGAAGKSRGVCWVPTDFITHVFGQGTEVTIGSKPIPASGKQEGDPSALTLQITPFNKVLNTPYSDPTKLGSINPSVTIPTFSSISFNLPDPKQPVDIDSNIPLILIGYNSTTYANGKPGITAAGSVIDPIQLNNYLNDYLFTNVNGVPRIAKATTGVYTNLPTIISQFKAIVGNIYNTGALNYCTGSNLEQQFCTDWCSLKPVSAGAEGGAGQCDVNLTNWCQLGPDQKPYTDPAAQIFPGIDSLDTLLTKFPNSKNNICKSFMPAPSYYKAHVFSSKIMPENSTTIANPTGINFISGSGTNYFKYTDIPDDQDCAKNWNYYSSDG
jgi:hypothetical protein